MDEGEPNEATLVQRAQQGEVAAYEELMRRHRPAAYRAALSVTGDADEAEDATQDACIKAYYALASFEPGAAFRPWLLRISVNEARNRRRSSTRRAQLAERAAAESVRNDSPQLEPELAFLQLERREAVQSALSQLRPDERTVVGSRYFAALSEAEMADTLGIARGTVKSRLSRALARLRTSLAAASLGLLLIVCALLAASREARDALADRLGLRGVDIIHQAVPTEPTPRPQATPTLAPMPTRVATLNLGTLVSLEEARSRNGNRFLEPSVAELGALRAIYIQEQAGSHLTTLVYTPPPGPLVDSNGMVLFAQLLGTIEPAVLGKGIGPDTTITAVSVDGNRAYWLAGHPHSVFFRDAAGQYREDTIRMAGNTLLWERASDALLRLEGVPTIEQALRIASSVGQQQVH